MITDDKKERSEPSEPPVDGPSPGSAGEEEEDTSAASGDKPG